jgi:hypothetical protein
MGEAKAKITHCTDVPAEVFGNQAPGVTPFPLFRGVDIRGEIG